MIPIVAPVEAKRQYEVFHVNDSTDDQVVFQAACHKAKVPFNWRVVDSAQLAIDYLEALVMQSKTVKVCWPDVVLLDIVMPVLTGFEVLIFIRATVEINQLPVVVFTGSEFPGFEEQAMKLGANAFMRKPADFGDSVMVAQQIYTLMKSGFGKAGS